MTLEDLFRNQCTELVKSTIRLSSKAQRLVWSDAAIHISELINLVEGTQRQAATVSKLAADLIATLIEIDGRKAK